MSQDSTNANLEPGASRLVSEPELGRVYRTERRVSIDDASSSGRMEFDAIARFLQDVGNDDTDDAGHDRDGLAWVARRLVVEVRSPGRPREQLALATWCSGSGRSWAERRTSMRGEHGAAVDAATVWIHVDLETGRPRKWGDDFAGCYLDAAGGRKIDARLRHPKQIPQDAVRTPWRFRRSDEDQFGHVNNAAYLTLVEELFEDAALTSPHRVEVEWHTPSTATESLEVARSTGMVWLKDPGNDELRVTISVEPLDSGIATG